MRDMHRKARHKRVRAPEQCGYLRGESSPTCKLTDTQVAAIRADDRVQRVVAVEYGVSQSYISALRKGKNRSLINAR